MKWKILLLDTKKQNPNHYLILGVYNALKQHKDVELVIMADYSDAIIKAQDNRCNLYFAFDGEQLEPAFCERLKNICGRSIVWNVEDPYEIPINKKNAYLFDLVFTNDKDSVSEYGSHARHLPLAACETLHDFEIINDNYRYDLFFAGTAWPNRVSLLKSIENEIEDIKFKLALPTNEHLPKINLDLDKSAYNWRTPNSEFARFSNRSAIVLSLHRQFTASDGREEAGTPGPRLFEVAMAGGFQLVDRNIPGIADYFIEGEDYAAFSSPQECIEKIKYYLTNPTERLAIARSSQSKVRENHTYHNRVQYIFEQLSSVAVSDEKPSKKIRTILVVAHNVVTSTPYGGVEIYLDLMKDKFNKNEFNILYYVPNHKSEEGKEYLLLDADYNEIDKISFPTKLPTTSEHMLSCDQREKAFGVLLNKYNIDLVHYQHLIRHVPSLPFISKALGIPSIFSVHDYFPITHRFNLIDQTGRYRPETFKSLRNADICLSEIDNIERGSQSRRIAFWSQLLKTFDVIHTNSQSTREHLLDVYPNLNRDKIVTRGIPCSDDAFIKKIESASQFDEMFEVLVLGNFTRVKGADTLLRVFNETRSSNLRFHVYGQVAPEFLDAINSLDFKHVVFHGEYQYTDLPEILKNKHVSLHLSIWPETYCITLSEVWRAGIVPIVTDVGALAERVTDNTGFKVGIDDVGAVIDVIEQLNIDRLSWKKIQNNIINEQLHESVNGHKEWLNALYQELINSRPQKHICNVESNIDLVTCGVKLNSIFWASLQNQPAFLQIPSVTRRIPRHPIHLSKFMLNQLKTRGIKVTLKKVIKNVKFKAGI